jgi:hypothetical protein
MVIGSLSAARRGFSSHGVGVAEGGRVNAAFVLSWSLRVTRPER